MRLRTNTLLLLCLALFWATACQSDKNAQKPDAEAPADEYTEAMAKEHAEDTPEASPAAMEAPKAEVVTEEVVYATVDGKPVTGYMARPKGQEAEELPGIVVIHEWWGLNDNIRKMTERLAAEGYVALAVDLYAGAVAEQPDEAKELMGAAMANPAPLKENLKQAVDYLDDEVEAEEIGVIGWCFGGAWSLQTALLVPDEIDATVVYYGHVGDVTSEQLAALDSPLIGFFGGEDQGIPVAQVAAFQTKLQELDKEATVEIYPEADHAFANPSGQNYQPEAAQDAWEKTLRFLKTHLQEDED